MLYVSKVDILERREREKKNNNKISKLSSLCTQKSEIPSLCRQKSMLAKYKDHYCSSLVNI